MATERKTRQAAYGACCFLLLVLGGYPASAQQQHAAGFSPPLTAWGAPDLQGMWSNASVTDLEREPPTERLVLTAEEAVSMEQSDFFANAALNEQQPVVSPFDQRRLDGEDLRSGGNYNAFWVDQGARVGRVRDELRSSWIIFPEDGRIPYRVRPTMPPGGEGEGRSSSRTVAPEGFSLSRSPRNPQRLTLAGPHSADPLLAGRPESYDNPETRPLSERCLIGFGSAGGPVMVNVIYNNRYQIVQTPDHAMILVEMVHDARIIPVFPSAAEARAAHRPRAVAPWLGDSVGWYEGNALVVETINPNPAQAGFLSAHGVLTERFSRWNSSQITYEFMVEDASLYTQTWRGEMALNATQPWYEYACHEGNYALSGVLSGARARERAEITRPDGRKE